MRILHAALGLFITGLTVAACTINQNDWRKNPELDEYAKYGGVGGDGGSTMTGGGGTGGSTCEIADTCPIPAEKCKERTCKDGVCGVKDRDCGALTCDPNSGLCAGCDDNDPQKECPPKDCHDIVCTNGTCVETPDGTLTCDGGNGTCDNAGNCGACTDGVQNGDETGVDCGPNTVCGKCNGQPCSDTNPEECKSDFCVDGVCCDTACDDLCQACDQSGKVGTCSALMVGVPDDDGSCDGMTEGGCGETVGYCRCNDGIKNGDETDVDCGGPTCGEQCGTGHSCSTTGDCISGNCADDYCCSSPCQDECAACNLPGLEGLCAPVDPGTTDTKCGDNDVCSVSGSCDKPSGQSCSTDGQCASNQCNTTCASCTQDSECDPTQVCEKNACFNQAAQGQPCPTTKACQAGLSCVDGVCCDTACDGLCMACHGSFTGMDTGTCARVLNGYDPHDQCPQSDRSQPGPDGSAYCSGAPADAAGNSSCAQPSP